MTKTEAEVKAESLLNILETLRFENWYADQFQNYLVNRTPENTRKVKQELVRLIEIAESR